MRVPNVQRAKGFNLVELMITIAVLAVLLAAASPSFADFFERYRLRSAVEDTFNLFVSARQGAVEADRNVNVSFGVSTTDWCAGGVQQAEPAEYQVVSTTPATCNCDPAACLVDGNSLVVNATGRRGVTIAAGGVSFTYDSKNGTLTDLSASPSVDFLSSSGRYGLRVLVSPLGQARACVISGKRPIPGYASC